jgi:ATP-binding cassette subfamily B multidrug efflux pump
MLKILKHLRNREWALAVLAAAFIVISVWAELTMPDYMSKITVLVQTEGSHMSEIIIAGVKMLMYALISLAANVCTASVE